MDTIVLKDKSVRPTDELIFAIIGEKSKLWESMLAELHIRYSDIIEQWNYYHDGKSWLFRVIKKKKTLCWVGVLSDSFRVTCYIGDKAAEMIEDGNLTETVKGIYRHAKSSRFGRTVSITMENSSDVDQVLELIRIKVNS